MAGENSDKYLALIHGPDFERCPKSGRPYERGSGALSKQDQTAMFMRQAELYGDIPKEGESCLYTGRPYDCSMGALTKTMQTQNFLNELPPSVRAQLQSAANALAAVEAAGRA